MNLAIMTMMFVVSQLRPRLPASRRTVTIRRRPIAATRQLLWDPTILAIIANNMELSTLEDAVTTARPEQDLIDLSFRSRSYEHCFWPPRPYDIQSLTPAWNLYPSIS
jgi:hypothetical protein